MCRIYATTMSHQTIKGKSFPAGSIVLTLETGTIIVCSDFQKVKQKLPVMVFSASECKWYKSFADGEIADILCKYQRRLVPKRNKTKHASNYADMMRHDRKHKKGGCGVRLDKENFYARQTITDYECNKNPMHDFARVYN